MGRPEYLHCPMTPEIIHRINENQEWYDRDPQAYEEQERYEREQQQMREQEEYDEYYRHVREKEYDEYCEQDQEKEQLNDEQNDLPF